MQKLLGTRSGGLEAAGGSRPADMSWHRDVFSFEHAFLHASFGHANPAQFRAPLSHATLGDACVQFRTRPPHASSGNANPAQFRAPLSRASFANANHAQFRAPLARQSRRCMRSVSNAPPARQFRQREPRPVSGPRLASQLWQGELRPALGTLVAGQFWLCVRSASNASRRTPASATRTLSSFGHPCPIGHPSSFDTLKFALLSP
ncbi:hypothetical protein LshimejAT787_2200600 [Lyophyllum shimeji]|uniref:Uncharacterized protein n=1 Tax=Lyophyllum shimeji TaxID=47721 RepID=A0A9P3PYH5_LYOSH|nr:hypothetical protein LshimejAT787_2200600 [Lyophyllum shimeji]